MQSQTLQIIVRKPLFLIDAKPRLYVRDLFHGEHLNLFLTDQLDVDLPRTHATDHQSFDLVDMQYRAEMMLEFDLVVKVSLREAKRTEINLIR